MILKVNKNHWSIHKCASKIFSYTHERLKSKWTLSAKEKITGKSTEIQFLSRSQKETMNFLLDRMKTKDIKKERCSSLREKKPVPIWGHIKQVDQAWKVFLILFFQSWKVTYIFFPLSLLPTIPSLHLLF